MNRPVQLSVFLFNNRNQYDVELVFWTRYIAKNAFHKVHKMTIVGLTVVQGKTLDKRFKILTAVKQNEHTIIALESKDVRCPPGGRLETW